MRFQHNNFKIITYALELRFSFLFLLYDQLEAHMMWTEGEYWHSGLQEYLEEVGTILNFLIFKINIIFIKILT